LTIFGLLEKCQDGKTLKTMTKSTLVLTITDDDAEPQEIGLEIMAPITLTGDQAYRAANTLVETMKDRIKEARTNAQAEVFSV
jgi:hypothetical protein